MGENLSALAISERCHCYGIILKSPKRHRAAEGSLLPAAACPDSLSPRRLRASNPY